LNEKLNDWLLITFKCIGALGGGVAIGGILYIFLDIEENASSKFWAFDNGTNMLLAGAATYGACFAICFFLTRHEKKKS